MTCITPWCTAEESWASLEQLYQHYYKKDKKKTNKQEANRRRSKNHQPVTSHWAVHCLGCGEQWEYSSVEASPKSTFPLSHVRPVSRASVLTPGRFCSGLIRVTVLQTCRDAGESCCHPPVRMMATWSGQREKRWAGGEGCCLHVTQCYARWQDSPLGKGPTSQAISGGITQLQHTEPWVMALFERGRGGDERQEDCKLSFARCSF